MAQSPTRFIGMDVHKDSIAGAEVAQEHGAAVLSLGSLGPRQGAIDHLIRTMPSTATHLLFVYDAGPCGDWLSRYLTKKGDDCWGVAPSLLPQKSGDRLKTDRRDAMQLARLARSGDLPAVSVPTGADDALRELTRARADALSACKAATLRLTACLLRQDIRSVGRGPWSPAHLRWLSAVSCPTPAQPLVFHEYVRAISAPHERLQRLDQALPEPVNAWRLSPVVDALQAWRGVPCPVAVTLVAERGDVPRVESPRERRKVMGLIASESSSGEQRRQGAITTAGTPHGRRVLVEGAGASRSPAQGSRHVPLRLEKHPKVIQGSSWKAPVRLCKRSRRLVARGQHANVVTVAIARALTGFLWAIAKEVASIAEDDARAREHASTRIMARRKVLQGVSAEAPPRWGVTLGGVRRLV